MRIRWDPKAQRFPGISGRFMFDTYRGQLRVRRWPRKRGKPKSEVTREQNAWFKAANNLAKRAEPTQMNLAIAMTKGTGLYPRDLLLKMISGGMWDIVKPDGRVLTAKRFFRETKVFQGAILELTATFAFPTSTVVPVIFPLPIRDTAGFWNVAAPTRLTIPAGITVVSLNGGYRGEAGPTNGRMIIGFSVNGTFRKFLDTVPVSTPGGTVSTGPMQVIAGDFFEFVLFVSQVSAAIPNGSTYFNLTVEEAS